ncbi:MAG: hypothetical protein ABIA66_03785 [Candidatus Omnitrophota bacterium]
MKKKIILLTVFTALLSVCIFNTRGHCDFFSNNRFTHASKTFSIIPPEGFKQILPREDGAQFVNQNDSSFIDISFSFAGEKFSDSQLIGRFDDEAFRKEFIAGLEQNMSSMNSEVTSSRKISVAGIPAWEFIAEGIMARGIFENRFIIFYKNKKSFFVFLGAYKDILDGKRIKLFEESLSTIDVR